MGSASGQTTHGLQVSTAASLRAVHIGLLLSGQSPGRGTSVSLPDEECRDVQPQRIADNSLWLDVYTNLERYAEAVYEVLKIRLNVFELRGRAQGLLGGRADDGCLPDLCETVEQSLLGVTVACALSAKVEKSGEQEGDNTHEDVNVELLVGPVVLRPKHHVQRILEVSKDRLDVSLTAVGADDVLGGPCVPIGHENEAAEYVAREIVHRLGVDLVLERDLLVSCELPSDDVLQVLASHQPGLDVTLNGLARTSLFAPHQRVGQMVEPLAR